MDPNISEYPLEGNKAHVIVQALNNLLLMASLKQIWQHAVALTPLPSSQPSWRSSLEKQWKKP